MINRKIVGFFPLRFRNQIQWTYLGLQSNWINSIQIDSIYLNEWNSRTLSMTLSNSSNPIENSFCVFETDGSSRERARKIERQMRAFIWTIENWIHQKQWAPVLFCMLVVGFRKSRELHIMYDVVLCCLRYHNCKYWLLQMVENATQPLRTYIYLRMNCVNVYSDIIMCVVCVRVRACVYLHWSKRITI